MKFGPLGKQFDRFLYAQVGDDQRGGVLSVVSALARGGVDPWEQAAILARAPTDSAEQTLYALLMKLPAESGRPADPKAVAIRLVALLPQAASLSMLTPAMDPQSSTPIAGGSDRRRAALLRIFYILALLGGVLLFLNH